MYIDIKELSFKGREVLKDVHLSFQEGDFISILGVNGSGKSSFYKALLGLVNYKGSTDVLQQDIAVVSDYVSLPSETPVADILGFVYEHSKMTGELESLRTMLNIDDTLNVKIHSLSSGQKRKLELFCAVASGCKIIIYDEVTANIDEPSQNMIPSFIKEYHMSHKNCLAFYSSHNLKEIIQLGGKKMLITPTSKSFEDVSEFTFEDIALRIASL